MPSSDYVTLVVLEYLFILFGVQNAAHPPTFQRLMDTATCPSASPTLTTISMPPAPWRSTGLHLLLRHQCFRHSQRCERPATAPGRLLLATRLLFKEAVWGGGAVLHLLRELVATFSASRHFIFLLEGRQFRPTDQWPWNHKLLAEISFRKL